MLWLPACGRTISVGVGSRASADWGDLKVFSTDVVPFEFEELSYISVTRPAASKERHIPNAMAEFRKMAEQLGADAILNLRVDNVMATGGGGFVLVVVPGESNWVMISGVAVRIKRP